jgi:anionic cell wall polymer biosynthesis LytR-Cps2A-Psr (LCP) family protein
LLGLRFGAITLGKVGYLASCLAAAVVLVLSGYAHNVVSLVSRTHSGANIGDSPSVGPMNILVMGLESRTNYLGENLDAHLIHVMHTGTNGGAQDTNTLILIHIFGGGLKAVGFSIPRDDLVTYPHPTYLGITRGKIDQAYDWAYNESLQQTSSTNESHDQRYLEANRAGQEFEVQTVSQLTGVHIDHFIEVNLAGFYYLAYAFHGLEVCIQPAPAKLEPDGLPAGSNLTDYDPAGGVNRSGFDAVKDGYNKAKGGKQYLHLDAAQSLAFVRSRHTLPGIDIGRTFRQQAAIDYVIWKVKREGLLTSFGAANSLLTAADQTLITDQQFNLLDFAPSMSALTGSHTNLTTLPSTPSNGLVVEPGFPNGEDVNYVDIPNIQREVQSAFYPRPGAGRISSGKPSASTQSVSARVLGTRTPDAAEPAAGSDVIGSLGGGVGAVAPNAPYGIPCVY